MDSEVTVSHTQDCEDYRFIHHARIGGDAPCVCGTTEKVVEEQIAEDTCSTHSTFCCPICFDMTTDDNSCSEFDRLSPRDQAELALDYPWRRLNGS